MKAGIYLVLMGLAVLAVNGEEHHENHEACPPFSPGGFCTMNIQPYHCASEDPRDAACEDDEVCCRDGCGHHNCFINRYKFQAKPNPPECPVLERGKRVFCTMQTEPSCEVGRPKMGHRCQDDEVCCRGECGHEKCHKKQ